MAIDTKTTAAGAVVLLLSGGTSYAITSSQSKDTSEETDSQQQGRTNLGSQEKKTSIEGKIKEFKFSLIKGQSDEGAKWKEIKDAIASAEKIKTKLTEEQLKQFCETNLSEAYSTSNDSKFQESVKKCTKLITFKERAGVLEIKVMEESDANWESKFTTLTKDKVQKLVEASSITFTITNSQITKDTLKEFCTKVGALNWTNLEGSNVTIETEWNNYLKGCTKEQNKGKNFWTGEAKAQ